MSASGPLVPDLTADWRVVRRAADALAEVIDNAVMELLESLTISPDRLQDEDLVNELTDRMFNFVTKGEHP